MSEPFDPGPVLEIKGPHDRSLEFCIDRGEIVLRVRGYDEHIFFPISSDHALWIASWLEDAVYHGRKGQS